MSHAAVVTPYVRLYTYSQYDSHLPVPEWALVAFVIAMLIAITALYRMIPDDSGWAGVVYSVTFIVFLGAMIIGSNASLKPPERTGDAVHDNVTLIEKSYKIRNIQPETPNTGCRSEEKSIERFAAPDSNTEPIRMAVTARSETGDGLLHLTLEKDPGNIVRAYEGTGDTQHLITPATAGTVKQGGTQ